MADALRSGRSVRKGVGVRISPSALFQSSGGVAEDETRRLEKLGKSSAKFAAGYLADISLADIKERPEKLATKSRIIDLIEKILDLLKKIKVFYHL